MFLEQGAVPWEEGGECREFVSRVEQRPAGLRGAGYCLHQSPGWAARGRDEKIGRQGGAQSFLTSEPQIQ